MSKLIMLFAALAIMLLLTGCAKKVEIMPVTPIEEKAPATASEAVSGISSEISNVDALSKEISSEELDAIDFSIIDQSLK